MVIVRSHMSGNVPIVKRPNYIEWTKNENRTKNRLTNSDVFVVVEDHPFVYFVRNAENVVLFAQIGNNRQFVSAEHLSQWIVWRIQNDRFGFLIEKCCQFVFIKYPIGRTHDLINGRRTLIFAIDGKIISFAMRFMAFWMRFLPNAIEWIGECHRPFEPLVRSNRKMVR